jgi:hypothetical protein
MRPFFDRDPDGLHLPEPRTDLPDATNGDDFVNEKGFFHGIDEQTSDADIIIEPGGAGCAF